MSKQLRQEAKRNEIIQRRYEINYFPKVKKAINSRVSSLIEIVKDRGVQGAINWLSTQVDSKDLPRVIEDLYLTVGLRFARIQYKTQKLETKGFGLNQKWIDYLKNHLFKFLLDKITFRVSETTREILLNTLSKSIQEGWGIAETVRALDELPLSATQAARIVRTEVTRAANTGTMAAADSFEFEQQKEWISAKDFRTRGNDPEDHASHKGMDGQVVDFNEPFIDPRNHDRLMFPGDPKAKAESTINCRCSMGIVAKRDERGRLIPKGGKIEKDVNLEIVEKEKEMDFTEILKPVYELREDVQLLRNEINNKDNIGELITEAVNRNIEAVNKNIDGVNKNAEAVNKDIENALAKIKKSNVGVLQSVFDISIENEDNRKKTIDIFSKEFNKVIDGIKGIEVRPEVDIHQDEVINEIRDMKDDIIEGLGSLKKAIENKPKNYEFVFTRNMRGLIESPIKVLAK